MYFCFVDMLSCCCLCLLTWCLVVVCILLKLCLVVCVVSICCLVVVYIVHAVLLGWMCKDGSVKEELLEKIFRHAKDELAQVLSPST